MAGEASPTISISDQDISDASDKLEKERSEREIPTLDKELGVWIGLPPRKDKSNETWTYIPNAPHVFNVSVLEFQQNIEGTNRGMEKRLNNVNVIEAHGHNPDGKWRFANGLEVVSTVKKFNEKYPENKIDCIISCNDKGDRDEQVRVWIIEMDGVAHVSGAEADINLTYINNYSSKVFMHVSIPSDGRFYGIEELEQKKEADKIEVKILNDNVKEDDDIEIKVLNN